MCLVALSVLLLNPFQFWMPDMMVIGILICAVVLVGLFAGVVLREGGDDEREEAHRALAGRNAFLMGMVVLSLGIGIGGYRHSVDPWLVGALVAMVLAKIASRIWRDSHR